MALTPRLGSPIALYHKLERELVRAFHHQNRTHKADHFYNFCITAHSIRDYVLEHLGKIANADAQRYHDAWSKSPVLLAVSDIANTAKHFQLRKGDRSLKAPRTKRVREGKTSVVYRGQYFFQKKSGVPTYVIEIEGGRKFELYAFMDEVAKYWKRELRAHGIRIRRQSSSQLHGT